MPLHALANSGRIKGSGLRAHLAAPRPTARLFASIGHFSTDRVGLALRFMSDSPRKRPKACRRVAGAPISSLATICCSCSNRAALLGAHWREIPITKPGAKTTRLCGCRSSAAGVSCGLSAFHTATETRRIGHPIATRPSAIIFIKNRQRSNRKLNILLSHGISIFPPKGYSSCSL
jgi:hypothetical protein